MILDFNNIPVKELEHFKGGEQTFFAHMADDGACKIMHGTLPPGASIGLHTHDDSCEIMYFLSGRGTVQYDGQVLTVGPGQVHYCPKGHTHTLRNEETDRDLVFIGIVPKQ